MSTGVGVLFQTGIPRETKECLLANVFLIRKGMWVENKPEGPTTWILAMYVDKINTIEGNNFVTVLLFNYDLYSLLHYRYESMLP